MKFWLHHLTHQYIIQLTLIDVIIFTCFQSDPNKWWPLYFITPFEERSYFINDWTTNKYSKTNNLEVFCEFVDLGRD